MIRIVDFKVIGEQTIHCAGCEQRIGNALRRMEGVEDVSASAQTQQVVVDLDPNQVSPAEIQARLELLGYEVTQGRD
ncbi:MAG: heavy-metal-associated domain-containing protein [Chloroflexota bacterium]|nr:heavy-metal-associated domain-containing protein [Chloroflexota bacterium]